MLTAHLLALLPALAGVLAAPASTAAEPTLEKRGPMNFVLGPDSFNPSFRRSNQTLARRSTNTNFNQDYTTGGTVNYTPGTNKFSVTWDTTDDFVVGVGWKPGSTA
jgi:endo-1,4-beta-xylanase